MRRLMLAALTGGVTGFVALTGHAGTALAADMPTYGGTVVERLPIVQEFVSGWYLRGDIGYRSNSVEGAVSNFPRPFSNDLNDMFSGGGGAGYKAQWFRADVTVDYAGKSPYSRDSDAFTGKIETLTALANVYIDLGTWGGITPYVGAGVGVTSFRAFDYQPPLGTVTVDSYSHVDLSWAYMAGFSYAIAPRLLVDLAYRRLHYGDVTFNAGLGNALTLTDLSAHEFRVGIRYTLD